MNIHTRKVKDLIQEAENGQIVLPNFQREYTYERSRQKDLIASLFCSIPVGSVLTMKGTSDSFSHREIGRRSEFKKSGGANDVTFLLDGQQRMTTFWNVLTDIFALDDRETRFDQIHNFLKSRWFFDFKKDDAFSEDVWGLQYLDGDDNFRAGLLPSDIEPAIVHKRGVKGNDLNWGKGLQFPAERNNETSQEKKYRGYLKKNWYVPIHLLTSPADFKHAVGKIATFRRIEIQSLVAGLKSDKLTWMDIPQPKKEVLEKVFNVTSQEGWQNLISDEERITEVLIGRAISWATKITTFGQDVINTDVGVIELGSDALGKAHVVFDAINKSGIKLSAFDLFCASKPTIDVRQRVNNMISTRVGMLSTQTDVASDEFTTQLMNLMRVIDAYKRGAFKQSCLKDDHIFKLSSEELDEFLDDAISSLQGAYHLLQEKAGLRNISEQPYKLQILPVAFAKYLDVCGPNDNHILAMYWLAMLGGKYRESQNSRCWSDLLHVKELANSGLPNEYKRDGDLWNSVLNVEDYNDKASLLPSEDDHEIRQSVNKSVLQFVLSMKPLDFPLGEEGRISAESSVLELHHILPLGSATNIGESSAEIRKNKKHILNSVLNMAWISKKSNRALAACDYGQYSQKFEGTTVSQEYGLPAWPEGADSFSEEDQRAWLEKRYDNLKIIITATLGGLVDAE